MTQFAMISTQMAKINGVSPMFKNESKNPNFQDLLTEIEIDCNEFDELYEKIDLNTSNYETQMKYLIRMQQLISQIIEGYSLVKIHTKET